MLAKEEGIAPEKLLLFSRLIAIQIPIIRFLKENSFHKFINMLNFPFKWPINTHFYKAYTGMYCFLQLTNNGDPSCWIENLEVDQ